MDFDGPTTKGQRDLARQLGITPMPSMRFGKLSQLINDAIVKRGGKLAKTATPAQLELAQRLGLPVDLERTTIGYLEILLTEARLRRSEEILNDNPALHADAVISYEGKDYIILSISRCPGGWQAILKPRDGGCNKRVSVLELEHVQLAEQ